MVSLIFRCCGSLLLAVVLPAVALAAAGGSPGDYDSDGVNLIWLILLSPFVGAYLAYRWYKVRRRRQQAHAAARQVSQTDPSFDPQRVEQEAGVLFLEIQRAWDARDIDRLGALLSPELLQQWQLKLDDFAVRGWVNHVQAEESPKVSFVHLDNSADDAADRITVFIQARLIDYVEGEGIELSDSDRAKKTTLAEFWTLGKRDGRWILMAVENEAVGWHHLNDPL